MKTILIVEDDVLNRVVTQTVLQNTYKVVPVSRGSQALDYLENNECDMILLDINMPEMNGFEVLERVQAMERCRNIPVIFLTADNDPETETRCFQMGAIDFITKPFVPMVLLSRINRVLELEELRLSLLNRAEEKSREASAMWNKSHHDALTGAWNRTYTEDVIDELLARGTTGALLMIDIDNFKQVNDNFGHIAGDKVLKTLTKCLREAFSREDVVCRLGGDEFAVFAKGMLSKQELRSRVSEVASRMHHIDIEDGLEVDVTISVGIAQAQEDGNEFSQLYSCADKALYFVKKNGKNGCHFFRDNIQMESSHMNETVNLSYLQDLMNREDKGTGAYQMDFDSFHHVYNFIHRFIDRSYRDVQIVLFTVSEVGSRKFNAAEAEYALSLLEKAVFTSLRRSDVSTRYSSRQLIVILMDANTENGDRVAERIIENFNKEYKNGLVNIDYGITRMNARMGATQSEDWIIIVDNDAENLKTANRIFSEAKIHARYFRSGQDMLDYLDGTRVPMLILLDMHMPEMNGFEVLRRLRQKEAYRKVPVIFLTADDNLEEEKQGLNTGAVDFVKKPFAAEVLLMRVRNMISLYRLQNEMERELRLKTEKLSHVYLEIVKAMSLAIDAKDTYTNGHSTRVAEYVRLIARRAGYSEEMQNQIYITGLLHDMGKIGIPDAIINKAGKLDQDEYEIIKTHPQIGAQILQSISEFPELSIGARWHHERYDGKGYPDGLSGQDIPEMARMIAVADAYDAMTSYRSYRQALPQEAVKAEFTRCRGTQFDPEFTDIILQLMEEDKDYQMRSK